MKSIITFLSFLILFLSFSSCGHYKRERMSITLSEAENRIAADAEHILGISKRVDIKLDSSKVIHSVEEKMDMTMRKNSTMKMDSVVKGYNRFACELLGMALKRTRDFNIIVSPLSIEMLLSLVANGVDQEASVEILNFLHIPSIETLNYINRYWFELCRDTDSPSEISFSNSIWSREGINFKKEYVEKMEHTCDVSFFPLDLNSGKAQMEINLWVSEKTHGMIPNFLKEPLKPSTMVAFYNACFFKDKWRMPFTKEDTNLSEFKTPKGKIKVPTMHGDPFATLHYTDNYQAVDLDYSDKTFCMRIVLPNEGYTLEEVIKELAVEPYETKRPPVILSMPKFKIRYNLENMEDILKQAGVRSIFSNPQVFLPMIYKTDLLEPIELQQETVIECDEEGTSVAAVTGSGWATSSGEPIKYLHFNVNRPFIFLVVEKKSDSIMFCGVVRDPTK